MCSNSQDSFYAQDTLILSANVLVHELLHSYADDPIYIFNAYNSLGSIYEEKGDYTKAGEIYEIFISKYKNSVFLPTMLLNAGKAYYLSKNIDDAKRNFLKITNDFKDSKQKQEAVFFLELLN